MAKDKGRRLFQITFSEDTETDVLRFLDEYRKIEIHGVFLNALRLFMNQTGFYTRTHIDQYTSKKPATQERKKKTTPKISGKRVSGMFDKFHE